MHGQQKAFAAEALIASSDLTKLFLISLIYINVIYINEILYINIIYLSNSIFILESILPKVTWLLLFYYYFSRYLASADYFVCSV